MPFFVRSRPTDSESGVVLVTVLWLLVLVALITTTLLILVRIEVKARANLTRQAEVEVLAEGLAHLVAFKLSRQAVGATQDILLPVDGSELTCRVDGSAVRVRIFDSAGLVDLNAAPLGLLESFFQGLGASKGRAMSLAAAVIDYRDADDTRLPHGAEQSDYLSAGLKHGPKNAPFETVMEVDQVLGFDTNLFMRSWHLMTVQSRLPGLDPGVAPLELLGMLSGGQLDGRGSAQSAGAERLRGGFRATAAITRTRSRDFAIHVQVAEGTRRAYRQAVIEITVQSRFGFRFREWQRGLASDWTPPRLAELQECFAGLQ